MSTMAEPYKTCQFFVIVVELK